MKVPSQSFQFIARPGIRRHSGISFWTGSDESGVREREKEVKTSYLRVFGLGVHRLSTPSQIMGTRACKAGLTDYLPHKGVRTLFFALFFSEAENAIFPFRSREGMRHFRPGLRKKPVQSCSRVALLPPIHTWRARRFSVYRWAI